MRNIDFSPLFRNSIGFDHLQPFADAAVKSSINTNRYPPYNIEQLGETGYRISMAVAGFRETDLNVALKENQLVITGNQPENPDVTLLHHGLASRAFERHFQLAEHIKVKAAILENGLLNIDLIREIPEEKKPQSITIQTQTIPQQTAA